VEPLGFKFNYAFLTATRDALVQMGRFGINPFVAVENPSERLIYMLKMRKSPSAVT
jgi:hypothetical protein